jgi:hypothetical protein
MSIVYELYISEIAYINSDLVVLSFGQGMRLLGGEKMQGSQLLGLLGARIVFYGVIGGREGWGSLENENNA